MAIFRRSIDASVHILLPFTPSRLTQIIPHSKAHSGLVILLLAVQRRLFCFGSSVILDVVCRYLSLFLLYINIEIGENRY